MNISKLLFEKVLTEELILSDLKENNHKSLSNKLSKLSDESFNRILREAWTDRFSAVNRKAEKEDRKWPQYFQEFIQLANEYNKTAQVPIDIEDSIKIIQGKSQNSIVSPAAIKLFRQAIQKVNGDLVEPEQSQAPVSKPITTPVQQTPKQEPLKHAQLPQMVHDFLEQINFYNFINQTIKNENILPELYNSVKKYLVNKFDGFIDQSILTERLVLSVERIKQIIKEELIKENNQFKEQIESLIVSNPEILGNGIHSNVYSLDNEKVVKISTQSNYNKNLEAESKFLEIALQKNLNCVPKYYDSGILSNNLYYIVMERINTNNENSIDAFYTNRGEKDPRVSNQLIKQLIQDGNQLFDLLKNQGVVNPDIKGNSIWFDPKSNTFKFIDFSVLNKFSPEGFEQQKQNLNQLAAAALTGEYALSKDPKRSNEIIEKVLSEESHEPNQSIEKNKTQSSIENIDKKQKEQDLNRTVYKSSPDLSPGTAYKEISKSEQGTQPEKPNANVKNKEVSPSTISSIPNFNQDPLKKTSLSQYIKVSIKDEIIPQDYKIYALKPRTSISESLNAQPGWTSLLSAPTQIYSVDPELDEKLIAYRFKNGIKSNNSTKDTLVLVAENNQILDKITNETIALLDIDSMSLFTSNAGFSSNTREKEKELYSLFLYKADVPESPTETKDLLINYKFSSNLTKKLLESFDPSKMEPESSKDSNTETTPESDTITKDRMDVELHPEENPTEDNPEPSVQTIDRGQEHVDSPTTVANPPKANTQLNTPQPQSNEPQTVVNQSVNKNAAAAIKNILLKSYDFIKQNLEQHSYDTEMEQAVNQWLQTLGIKVPELVQSPEQKESIPKEPKQKKLEYSKGLQFIKNNQAQIKQILLNNLEKVNPQLKDAVFQKIQNNINRLEQILQTLNKVSDVSLKEARKKAEPTISPEKQFYDASVTEELKKVLEMSRQEVLALARNSFQLKMVPKLIEELINDMFAFSDKQFETPKTVNAQPQQSIEQKPVVVQTKSQQKNSDPEEDKQSLEQFKPDEDDQFVYRGLSNQKAISYAKGILALGESGELAKVVTKEFFDQLSNDNKILPEERKRLEALTYRKIINDSRVYENDKGEYVFK